MRRLADRPLPRSRAALALAGVMLLAAGCGGGGPQEPAERASGETSAAAAASDGGGASDVGGSEGPSTSGSSDSGGSNPSTAGTESSSPADVDPQADGDSIPVTPAPEGFAPPQPCTGEGGHAARVDSGPATPELPERDGEELVITATAVDGDHATMAAAIGDQEPRLVEPITLGENVTVGSWTLSVTSVCADTEQVEFDLID